MAKSLLSPLLLALALGCSSSGSSALATAGAFGQGGAAADGATAGESGAADAAIGGGASAGYAGTADARSTSETVTFHRDVEPILQRSCQSCHVEGGIAPFALFRYEDARSYASAIVADTAARIMPPWHAEDTAECHVPLPWKNDVRLSDAQIATLKAWRDAGAPEGDPEDAPPPRAPVTGLAGVQLELAPTKASTVAPGADDFRCFVLDPKLVKDSYVNGMFVVPGNDAVVHHVLVFADPSGASRAKADADGTYKCFGGVQVADADLLMAWTPGGVPLEYPSNVAAPVTAGSLLVMQVHYHPHSTTESEQDTTRIQLRFLDHAPPYNAVTRLIGNFRSQLPTGDGLLPGPDDPASGPAFLIPANADAHTETMQFTYRGLKTVIPAKLYGIGGHMHYVGVDEKVSVHRADGSDVCLMQIPHWDFDWQRRYDYDASIANLPALASGDQLLIRCTYDNTMDNAAVAESLEQQGQRAPHDVTLGETTLDEMCLANVTVLYPSSK